MHEIDGLTGFFWTTLGALGGAVKVLVQLLGMQQLPPWGRIMWLLFANMLVSGFAGFMGALLMSLLTPDDNLHVVASGISGYMGVAALDLFSDWFKKRVVSGVPVQNEEVIKHGN